MKRLNIGIVAFAAICATTLLAQSNDATDNMPETTLKVNSRAVLVDVIVSDKNGNPVKGLKQSDFSISEAGKPQSIGFLRSILLRIWQSARRNSRFHRCHRMSSVTTHLCRRLRR